MTSLGEVITSSTGALSDHSPSPRLDAELLTGHALSLSRSELYSQHARVLTAAELGSIDSLVERRSRREPVAYILGRWGFRGLDLAVDRRVLVPRPETEELVDVCLEFLTTVPAPAVLDVGTGSGAIALAIAQELPAARVAATDISPGALELARANCADLGLDVEWLESDLLAAVAGRRFDLIVSNPPYIPAADLDTLEPEVRVWEPRIATTPGQDGLELLLGLVQSAPAALTEDGLLALECGAGQSGAVAEALTSGVYTDVAVREDFAGIERFVTGRRP